MNFVQNNLHHAVSDDAFVTGVDGQEKMTVNEPDIPTGCVYGACQQACEYDCVTLEYAYNLHFSGIGVTKRTHTSSDKTVE